MRRAELSKILLLCILATAAPIPAAAAEEAATTSVSETATDSQSSETGSTVESAAQGTTVSSKGTSDAENEISSEGISVVEEISDLENDTPSEEDSVSEEVSLSENDTLSEGDSVSEEISLSENDTLSEGDSVSEEISLSENDTPSEGGSVSEEISASENDAASEEPTVSEDNSVSETDVDPALIPTEQESCTETATEGESNALPSTTEDTSDARLSAKKNTADRIHFIALNGEDYASDAILVESNGLYGLIDASNPSGLYKDTYNFADTAANGKTVVEYLTDINVTHLKFVLATHSHSDHIGGMPDVAASGAVDSDTVYIYKEYELNETAQVSFQNGYYADLAIDAMRETGASLLNLLNPDPEVMSKLGAELVKDKKDTVGDHILFSMGDFLIKLFNLHTESDTNENLNSVVTTVQKGDTRAVLMADMEMDDYMESRTVNAILRDDKTTETSVYKLGHHGYRNGTSLDTIKALNAQNYVVSTNSTDQNPEAGTIFNYFIEESGSKIYRTSENGSAVIADFGNKDVAIYKTVKKKGESPADPWNAQITDGWHVWYPDEKSFNVTGYKWIYIKSGAALSGWFKSGSHWYYADSDYVIQTGWLTIGKNRYYLGANGSMRTGWQKINNKWYYLSTTGAAQTGWQKIGGKWYYFNSDGVKQTGWVTSGSNKYYMGTDGVLRTGWQYISGKWYYLSSAGAVQTGWQKIDNKLYYMNSAGVKQTGWVTIGNKKYYLGTNGVLRTGWQKINNKWYYMNTSGVMQTGWQKIGNKWYYMNTSGVMQTGWQKISNKWYYMSAGGAMQTGWQKINNKWYYMGAGGVMQTGWQKIGNNWYYLETSGSMAAGKWVGNYYLKANGQMAVNEWIGIYYVGADGKWIKDYPTSV